MRRFSLTGLLGGLLLLGLALALSVGQHREHLSDLDNQLAAEAEEHAGNLDAYFERSRAAILLTANQAPFRHFDEAPGGRLEKVVHHRGRVDDAVHALDYLERLYPGAIGEACFIDRTGAEIGRVVRGQVAPASDLSTEEAGNTFFAATFARPAGRVYQAEPYVSPDTGEWVIANSTVVPSRDGVKRSMVHFEVTVESFRRAFSTDESHYRVSVIDRRTGRVVLEGTHAQRAGRPLGVPSDRRYVSLAGVTAGAHDVAGHRAAFAQVAPTRDSDNANDWVVVATSTTPLPGMLDDLGALPLSIGALGLLLALLSAIGLRSQRRELETAAGTDALTGLDNRRRLLLELESRLSGSEPEPSVLLLFDLDGFKAYNDAYGHLAGDTLLSRLGEALSEAVEPHGRAYRLGGDEFCVLALAEHRGAVEPAAAAALSEQGAGFTIGASHGAVVLPVEAQDPTEALRIADQRMYAAKPGTRMSAGRQSAAVLLRALAERHPDLDGHVDGVAGLAMLVADHLGLVGDDREHVRHAAQLHDIGKVAIPRSILGKPGSLDDREWDFIRRHTVIGERIVAAAPSLAPVGRLIRASHERWDGGGYPDGLAADEIPFGARIVAVCDAYEAMTAERPYDRARSHADAIAELHRCSGAQFDPAIVSAFVAVTAAPAAFREAA